eukprot:3927293-Ditylum_brightwellii.AAC.1
MSISDVSLCCKRGKFPVTSVGPISALFCRNIVEMIEFSLSYSGFGWIGHKCNGLGDTPVVVLAGMNM